MLVPGFLHGRNVIEPGDQISEDIILLNREGTFEAAAQQIEVALRQQSDRDDFFRHRRLLSKGDNRRDPGRCQLFRLRFG